jgi:hypothetical protein
MYRSADFISIPFQYYVFAVATLLNFILDRVGVVGWSISFCIRIFVKEIAVLKTPSAQGTETIEEIIKKVIAELRADLGADRPVGKVVGFVERELYFYALILPVHGLITAVLLFKAFSGWLKLADTPDLPASKGVLSSSELMGLQTLVRYYSYAMGNFVSLAWAILIFEGLRIAMRFYPPLAGWLLIPVSN